MANEEKSKNQAPQKPMGGGRHGYRPVEKPKDFKGTIKKISKYIGYSKGLFIALFIIVVIVTVLSLLAPIVQKNVFNDLWSIEEIGVAGFEKAVYWIIVLAIVYGANCIVALFRNLVSGKLSQRTVHKLRSDLFAKFVKLPIKFIDNHSHGDLMSRMTNDVDSISNAISQVLASLISGVLLILGTLVMMLYYSWLLTLVTLVSTALTIVASMILTKKMGKYFKRQSALLGELNGHTEEMITGYRTVVAYNKEKDVEEEFYEISDRYTKTSIIAQIWGGSMGPVMNFIGNLTYVLIAIVGGWMALTHPWGLAMDVGTIALFLTCSRQFSRPINEIAQLYGQILTATAGAERVFEVLESPNEIDEGTIHLSYEDFQGNIEFKGVNFGYVEEKPVLKDFTLDVIRCQKIALVGATGSGKTTVVNLLMRFYEIDSGEILIDGINIKDIYKDDLRKTIAIVLQDTVLFKDTIEANIKYGNDNATFDEMKAAAILANANYFVKKLPEKYETVLSEGGSNISQGQRQLLTIARAVLADPKILILDEATSNVDTRTEKNIQDAMVNLMANRTSLIIAHRLSTIQDADVIVVMDQGRICEMGNHEKLLEVKGKYYDLYMTQFAGREI